MNLPHSERGVFPKTLIPPLELTSSKTVSEIINPPVWVEELCLTLINSLKFTVTHIFETDDPNSEDVWDDFYDWWWHGTESSFAFNSTLNKTEKTACIVRSSVVFWERNRYQRIKQQAKNDN